MKLTANTIAILKNLSQINQSIVFKEGHTLKTINPRRSVFASAEVEDKFPTNAGIYNLPRFLSVYGMYKDPDLNFGDQYVTLSEGKSKTKYQYADPSMIITPPEKGIKLPSVDVSVISSDDIARVLKATSVLQLPEVAFVGEGGTCYLRAIDSATPSSDSFGVEVGNTDNTFNLIIKTENLQLMPGDYQVDLSEGGISRFKSDKITYFVAVESKSSFKGNK
jgi:hypothetical protein